MGEQKGKEQGRREKEKGFSKGKASNSPTELFLIMPRGFWLTFMLVLILSAWKP